MTYQFVTREEFYKYIPAIKNTSSIDYDARVAHFSDLVKRLFVERDMYRKAAIFEAENADRNASWDVDVAAARLIQGKILDDEKPCFHCGEDPCNGHG